MNTMQKNMARIDADTFFSIIDMKQLYARAIRFTKHEENAEDLVQETLLKALRNLDNLDYRSEGHAVQWTLTIMRNLFINHYRRDMKKKEKYECNENYIFDYYFSHMNHKDPEQVVVEKGYSEELQLVLDDMADGFKEVLLEFVGGKKYNEVAEDHDLPIGTVMSRLFRARKFAREDADLREYAKQEYGICA